MRMKPAVTIMVMACSFFGATASQTCYFLQSSGCKAGTSDFCQNGMKVCDTGYGTIDTGCGKEGPANSTVSRRCYVIRNVITAPCDGDSPGGYYPTGCRDGTVCCYAKDLNQTNDSSPGNMLIPTGAPCGCSGGGGGA